MVVEGGGSNKKKNKKKKSQDKKIILFDEDGNTIDDGKRLKRLKMSTNTLVQNEGGTDEYPASEPAPIIHVVAVGLKPPTAFLVYSRVLFLRTKKNTPLP